MEKMKLDEAINIVQKTMAERRLIIINAIRQAQIAHGNKCSQVLLLRQVYEELLLSSSIIEKYRDCW